MNFPDDKSETSATSVISHLLPLTVQQPLSPSQCWEYCEYTPCCRRHDSAIISLIIYKPMIVNKSRWDAARILFSGSTAYTPAQIQQSILVSVLVSDTWGCSTESLFCHNKNGGFSFVKRRNESINCSSWAICPQPLHPLYILKCQLCIQCHLCHPSVS